MGVRLYSVAKEIGIETRELIQFLARKKIKVKSASSTIEPELAEKIKKELLAAKKPPAPPKKKTPRKEEVAVEKPPPAPEPKKAAAPPKRKITVKLPVNVRTLAPVLGVDAGDLISKLMGLGVMATINQNLDSDTVEIVAHECGLEVEVVREEPPAAEAPPEREEDLVHRAPVVTFMGHIDHGKTSLLDAIRESKVAAREAGGITQHIGAYEVSLGKKRITFLDTPGHETFTAMRARGAKVTDIAVLVVAADEGVMPQTREAIDHARAAEVPIIVAVNKIDKPSASPEKVRGQLMELGLTPEEYGGQTIFCDVSAVTRKGLESLLEMILLQAEMMELKANPQGQVSAVIIEAKLDKGRGPVATALIERGTLRSGDSMVCGGCSGRVRALFDYSGAKVSEAGLSKPVQVIGFNGVPEPGDEIIVVGSEKEAKRIAEERRLQRAAAAGTGVPRMTLEDLFTKIASGKTKELRLILKGDVQGSIEALRDSLEKLSSEKVTVNIIRCAVGDVTESDVMLAAASDAVVIGFHARIDLDAKELSRRESVEIKMYNIIYEVIEDVHKAMEGLLEPLIREIVLGRAEVRQLFRAGKGEQVAGCLVADGKVVENARARVIRGEKIVHEGTVASLRRFKDPVKEVKAGTECGVRLLKYEDMQEGDTIEIFKMEKVPQKLQSQR